MDDFRISLLNLEQQWVEQADLMHSALQALAERRYDYELSKTRFKELIAEISLDVRANPEDYNLERATDKSVESAVACSKLAKASKRKVLKSQKKYNEARARVHALGDRRRTLEHLVALWSRDYFSSPTDQDRVRRKRKAKCSRR